MKKITKKQIKLIHILISKLALDEELYRDILKIQFGVDSSTKLSREQATELINFLLSKNTFVKKEVKSFCKKRITPNKIKFSSNGKIIKLATKDQFSKIEKLKSLIKWKHEDGFERWLKNRMKLNKIVTVFEAQDVIEGLKGLLKNQKKGENYELTRCV